MGSRTSRALASLCLLLVLSGCEMTAQLTTRLNADGSGTFTLAIGIDRELRDLLQAATDQGLTATSGIADLEALFDGLGTDGWSVSRLEPDGGLRMEASKGFADAEEFGALLGDIRTARTGEGSGFEDISFELGYATSSSFLRRGVRFFGLIDTGQEAPTERERAVQDAIARDLRFEIRTELPGSITDTSGNGAVDGGTVVWRPQFGDRMDFSADASSLRVGALMMVMIPGLALLAGIGWFGLGRRRHGPDDDDGAPSWTDELVALKPDLEPEPMRSVDVMPIDPIDPIDLTDAADGNGNGAHANGSSETVRPAPVDPVG